MTGGLFPFLPTPLHTALAHVPYPRFDVLYPASNTTMCFDSCVCDVSEARGRGGGSRMPCGAQAAAWAGPWGRGRGRGRGNRMPPGTHVRWCVRSFFFVLPLASVPRIWAHCIRHWAAGGEAGIIAGSLYKGPLHETCCEAQGACTTCLKRCGERVRKARRRGGALPAGGPAAARKAARAEKFRKAAPPPPPRIQGGLGTGEVWSDKIWRFGCQIMPRHFKVQPHFSRCHL